MKESIGLKGAGLFHFRTRFWCGSGGERDANVRTPAPVWSWSEFETEEGESPAVGTLHIVGVLPTLPLPEGEWKFVEVGENIALPLVRVWEDMEGEFHEEWVSPSIVEGKEGFEALLSELPDESLLSFWEWLLSPEMWAGEKWKKDFVLDTFELLASSFKRFVRSPKVSNFERGMFLRLLMENIPRSMGEPHWELVGLFIKEVVNDE